MEVKLKEEEENVCIIVEERYKFVVILTNRKVKII